MSNDSHLFADSPADADDSDAPKRLPLYEAKMIHQFDHRWATYVDNADKPNGLDTHDVPQAQKADPSFTVRPRYWVEEPEVLARIARVPSRVANDWLAFKSATDTALGHDGGDDELVALATSRTALTLAVAQWVAGGLLRACAEGMPHVSSPSVTTADMFAVPATDVTVTNQTGNTTDPLACLNNTATAWALTQQVEVQMSKQYRWLADALKADGTTGKKALPLFQKWALQDDPSQGLGLSADELAQLQALQGPGSKGFELEWLDVWMDWRSPRWLISFRGITNATNERSFISTVMPRLAAGNSLPLMHTGWDSLHVAALQANLSSLALDFVARQKIGGTNLNFFIVKQFPVLPPDRYEAEELAFIVPRVLELTHTAQDMQAWADDLMAAMPSADPRPPEQQGTPLHPFPWNTERRAQLRAELDAYYARLYGLTRDELRYILDPADVMGDDYPSETFRVLKNSEMREFGEYRTQRLVLAAWDQQEQNN